VPALDVLGGGQVASSFMRCIQESRDEGYESYLAALGKRIKARREECGLSLRDMVLLHGCNESVATVRTRRWTRSRLW
jgi:hypothetical protein